MLKALAKTVAVTAMAVMMAAMASTAWSMNISSELTVATTSDLEYNGIPLNIDAQLCSFRGPNITWVLGTYDKENHSIPDYNNINGHVFATGPMDDPFQSVSFVGNQTLFNHTISDDGVFWISSMYQDAAGILAVIHAEGVNNTVPYPGPGRVSKTRVGLAWLANGSGQYDFLGHQILMHSDPTNNYNIQGAPYLIKNGYLYVYYHDYHGIGVSRAPLSTIINNAKNGVHLSGSTSWFQKYYWKDIGGGNYIKDWGNALDPNLIGVTQLDGNSTLMGSSHGDIIHSSTTGKYYMATSGLGNHPYDTYGYYQNQSFIRIYQSTDGLNWSFADDITCSATDGSQEGYQYVSMISTTGYDNGECGSSFYIYSGKDMTTGGSYDNQINREFVRFTVTP